ncbi:MULTISPECIES: helix-turn-helix domain-containing protein [Pseudomonas]|jgi:transcriptional regulator with XRE-family HTH domain|uniref:helix-turn-helix domain-containing protein n=1 Tax=Pseudomonas TaxID=286 RepID=UPI0005FAACE9|nr:MULTISPECIES: helix-turn-helix transcriptional regulator [Pseudomonas]KJZ39885.1 XRE family transcriptional regulator [Pseudomonas fluorescens]
MDVKQAFGVALRINRKNKGLTQEDFSQISSRTYLSALERGLKSPTLDKIEQLASVIDIHPLTLLASCYLYQDSAVGIEELFNRIRKELESK